MWINQVWRETLEWVFPQRCLHCQRIDRLWCERCHQALGLWNLEPVTKGSLPHLVAVMATGWHEDILRDAVRALKFDGVRDLAYPLAQRLAALLASLSRWTFDCVMPVPLHPHRETARGYNQSHLLCQALTHFYPCHVMLSALHRDRNTPPQVGLNQIQRRDNMHGAFSADPTLVTGKSVLLVDDVFTTGATLEACAKALAEAGTNRCYGLTVTAARPKAPINHLHV